MIEKEAYSRLLERGVRPSVQRLAIMQYLLAHHTHPTVDEVYTGLSSDIPTLSRTTVYNTLRMFSDLGAASMLTIDEHRVCYDGNIMPHSHFYCEKCKRIYDLQTPSVPESHTYIEGNKVNSSSLYYRGVCKNCLKEKANEV